MRQNEFWRKWQEEEDFRRLLAWMNEVDEREQEGEGRERTLGFFELSCYLTISEVGSDDAGGGGRGAGAGAGEGEGMVRQGRTDC